MTNLKADTMHTVSVAQAGAHLSELLGHVEMGEESHISRRGRAIARLVPEPKEVANTPFDQALGSACGLHGVACRSRD